MLESEPSSEHDPDLRLPVSRTVRNKFRLFKLNQPSCYIFIAPQTDHDACIQIPVLPCNSCKIWKNVLMVSESLYFHQESVSIIVILILRVVVSLN